MIKLFLDDIRQPPDATWVVVRSHDAFIDFLQSNPTPELISFDHDLGENAPTGMDCAKWLVENGCSGFDFTVHSANPPGRANIEGLLRNWLDFCKSEVDR